MMQSNLNDYFVEIMQDFYEIESIIKVVKDSIQNENRESTITDVNNTVEIILAKIVNTRKSLEKYIDNFL